MRLLTSVDEWGWVSKVVIDCYEMCKKEGGKRDHSEFAPKEASDLPEEFCGVQGA